MAIKIITDSTCDLPKEYIERNDILVIPLSICFDETSYYDGVDLTTKELYKKIEEKNELPKTSAISISQFINTFKQFSSIGYDIIFIGISSQLSSTYQNAFIAKQELGLDNIYIHDSLNLSTGIGLQVMRINDLIKANKSLREIIEIMRYTTPRVKSKFMVEKLDNLYRGGRCSSLQYYASLGFKIKPIIHVENGKLSIFKKTIGKSKKACDVLINALKEDYKNVDSKIFITSSYASESVKYILNEIKTFVPENQIILSEAGCVISTHCGKGTVGILYIVK